MTSLFRVSEKAHHELLKNPLQHKNQTQRLWDSELLSDWSFKCPFVQIHANRRRDFSCFLQSPQVRGQTSERKQDRSHREFHSRVGKNGWFSKVEFTKVSGSHSVMETTFATWCIIKVHSSRHWCSPKEWMRFPTQNNFYKKTYLGWIEHWWLPVKPPQENSQRPAMKFRAKTNSGNSLAKILGTTAHQHLLKNTLHHRRAKLPLMEVPSSWSVRAEKNTKTYMLNRQLILRGPS